MIIKFCAHLFAITLIHFAWTEISPIAAIVICIALAAILVSVAAGYVE